MKLKNTYIALKRVNEHSHVVQPMGAREMVIRQGEVVGVDESVEDIEVGDILVFPEYAHHTIKIKNEEYIFVKAEEVICKI